MEIIIGKNKTKQKQNKNKNKIMNAVPTARPRGESDPELVMARRAVRSFQPSGSPIWQVSWLLGPEVSL
jgi:hypothetical protein